MQFLKMFLFRIHFLCPVYWNVQHKKSFKAYFLLYENMSGDMTVQYQTSEAALISIFIRPMECIGKENEIIKVTFVKSSFDALASRLPF